MILISLSLLAAHADVPPPTGQKRVPYYAEVLGAPTQGPHRLAVYPASTSGGAPEARLEMVPATGRVELGRRIMGEPAFWLIPEGEVPSLQAMDEAALKAWFEAGGAIRCDGPLPSPRHTVSVLGGSEIVDRFALDEQTDTSCRMSQLARGEASGTGAGPQGCTCTTASAVVLPGWLSFVVLVLARRRRR